MIYNTMSCKELFAEISNSYSMAGRALAALSPEGANPSLLALMYGFIVQQNVLLHDETLVPM